MKKTILALALGVAGAVSSFAQGTVAVNNIATAYLVYTNSATYTTADNGVYNTTGVKTGVAANGFYYALLVQPNTGALSAVNPLDGNYSLAMMATNFGVAGGVRGVGADAGGAVNNWGAPSGATYNTGSQDYYILVGWSSSLGTTWAAVQTELQTGNWAAAGAFGVSQLGMGYSGGGPNNLGAPNVFGTGVNAGGLTQGLTLFTVVPSPEPASMALIGLGGATLLLFRRKK